MVKHLQTLIPAGLRKIGLVTAIVLASCFYSFGQNFKTETPVEQQFSPSGISQIFKFRFRHVTIGKPAQTASSSNARLAAVQSLPLNNQTFNPDAANSGWILNGNGRYTYDAQGNQTSLTRIPVASYPSLKDSALFDMHGNRTFNASYTRTPSGNTWNMDSGDRSQYTYNAAGKPTEIITERFNSLTWEKSSREVIVYNAAGYATENTFYKWQNSSWVSDQKFIYGFAVPTNPPSSLTLQTYNGSSWVNLLRFQNLTWHNFNQGEYLTREEQTWSMNTWIAQSRSTVVFDLNGGSVNISESYNGVTWENAERNTITKNNHSDITGLKHESWHNNTWAFGDEKQFVLTYNAASQLTETIMRNYDTMTNSMKNASRTTYTNFVVMGTRKEEAKPSLTVYPNPVTEVLHIEAEASEDVKATLTELTGKVVLSQNLPVGSSPELNLMNLAKGTYLLKLETHKGTSLQKIVKQ